MKNILFVLFAIFLCVRSSVLLEQAGTTATSTQTWSPPSTVFVSTPNANFPSNSQCASQSVLSQPIGLQTFSHTTSADSLHLRIIGNVDHSFLGNARIYMYQSSFNSSSPCTNFLGAFKATTSSAPHFNIVLQFNQTQQTYIFVLSGRNLNVQQSKNQGFFAIQFSTPSVANAAQSSWQWTPPTEDSFGSNCSASTSGSEMAKVASFSPVSPSSSLYDVMVGFGALSDNVNENSVGLYSSDLDTSASDYCQTSLVAATTGPSVYQLFTEFSQVSSSVASSASGKVVASSASFSDKQLVAFVEPTRTRTITNHTSSYRAPEFSLGFETTPYQTTCIPGTKVFSWYDAVTFQASSEIYVIDVASTDLDLVAVLYKGDNTGVSGTCSQFIAMSDVQNGGSLHAVLSVGSQYTVVIVPFYPWGVTADISREYQLFMMTGSTVTDVPAPAPTTYQPTNGPTPTNGVTSDVTDDEPNDKSTSAIIQIQIGFMLLMLGLVSLL